MDERDGRGGGEGMLRPTRAPGGREGGGVLVGGGSGRSERGEGGRGSDIFYRMPMKGDRKGIRQRFKVDTIINKRSCFVRGRVAVKLWTTYSYIPVEESDCRPDLHFCSLVRTDHTVDEKAWGRGCCLGGGMVGYCPSTSSTAALGDSP